MTQFFYEYKFGMNEEEIVIVGLDSCRGQITLCTGWQESLLIVPFFKSITSINFLLVCIVLSLFEPKHHLSATDNIICILSRHLLVPSN